jgi:hypothetical protein
LQISYSCFEKATREALYAFKSRVFGGEIGVNIS